MVPISDDNSFTPSGEPILRPGYVLRLAVTVGDKVFSRDQMTFWVRGQEYHFEDMKTITSVRWEFGEKAELFVPLINGLPEYGPTSIRVGIQILVSYSPFNRMSYAHMNYDRSASGGVCR